MDIFHGNFVFCLNQGFREITTTVSTPYAASIPVGCLFLKKQSHLKNGLIYFRLDYGWVCCDGLNSVLVLSLPLSFVVEGVAAVELTEHLPDSSLQPGCEKLDILPHTQIQNSINPLC